MRVNGMAQAACKRCGEPIIWAKRSDNTNRWHRPLEIASEKLRYFVEYENNDLVVKNVAVYDIHYCDTRRNSKTAAAVTVGGDNESVNGTVIAGDKYTRADSFARNDARDAIQIRNSVNYAAAESAAREYDCPLSDCNGTYGIHCKDVAEFMENDKVVWLRRPHSARIAAAARAKQLSPLYGDKNMEASVLRAEISSIEQRRRIIRRNLEMHKKKLQHEARAIERMACTACGVEPGDNCLNLNSLRRGVKKPIVSVHASRVANYEKLWETENVERRRKQQMIALSAAMRSLLERATNSAKNGV